MPDDSREQRFQALFDASFDDLTRFVRRRIRDGDDIVAETYLVAWRSLDQVPLGEGEGRAWLFTVARNLMANQRRKDARLVAWEPSDVPAEDESEAADTRIDLSRAFSRLSAEDQEVLALVVWEGLTSAQAASVLSITARAFRVRLHRARRRLRTGMHRSHVAPTPILRSSYDVPQ